MSSITAIEMKYVDLLLEQSGKPGYVLDFSNNTFASFFAQELKVDIYADQYSGRGTSKLKRLRCYLEVASDVDAAKALHSLWEYRGLVDRSLRHEEPEGDKRIRQIIARLDGKPIEPAAAPTPPTATTTTLTRALADQLQDRLIEVSKLAPHPRGIAFEKFLKDLFDAYGMSAQASFKLKGEQIDGSFRLDGQIYLLEAKWQNDKTGAADLHILEGKLGEKAAWSRGLFISQNGFTEEGLHAFGRGKRLICMDGLDLWEVLNGNLSLPDIIDRKAERAARTGEIFGRVRDLI
jgi:hypothetical protein